MSLTIPDNVEQIASEESDGGGSEDDELTEANNKEIRNPAPTDVIKHKDREMEETVTVGLCSHRGNRNFCVTAVSERT